MKFNLNLDIYEDDSSELKVKPISINTIKANNLIQLLTQFMLLIVRIQQDICDREIEDIKQKYINDDIPF